MSLNKIKTIIDKEWAEVFKNRYVLFLVAILPLILTLMPLGILFFTTPAMAQDDMEDLPPQFAQICGQLENLECMQVFILNQFLLLFMVIPLAIPATFAAYSIVGEKTTRCLEPLLATPITTAELLVGKSLAAAIPAILATWGGFIIFVLGVRLLVTSLAVFMRVIDPIWLIAILLIGPLLAIMGVNASLIASSRVNDPRTAEQLAMVVIIPLLGVFFGQLAGVILINIQFMLMAVVVLVLLDVGLIHLGIQLFERETILTRWK